jgi:hypothetical protein
MNSITRSNKNCTGISGRTYEYTVQNITSIACLYISAVSTEMAIVIFCTQPFESNEYKLQKNITYICIIRETIEYTLQIINAIVCLWNLLFK